MVVVTYWTEDVPLVLIPSINTSNFNGCEIRFDMLHGCPMSSFYGRRNN